MGSGIRTAFRLTALLAAAALMPCVPSAAAEQEMIGYRGDLNGDGTIGTEDAVLLTKHLTTAALLRSTDAAACADMDGNGILSAADLSLLKQQMLRKTAPEPVYRKLSLSAGLPEPPVKALDPTLPSVGTPRVLMVLVNFQDYAHKGGFTAEQVQERCFGPEDSALPSYPLESISAYYERASYGRLKLRGDVFLYTAKGEAKDYTGKFNALLEEVISGLDAQIDFTQYDSDSDGRTDAVVLAVPPGAGTSAWRAATADYTGNLRVDGITIGKRSVGCADLTMRGGFNSVWTHELGHAMGLVDYYKYTNTADGYYGLNGDAGWELMDDSYGDLSAFSKLMLGWYTGEEMQVYAGGTQTFQLPCSQDAPGCIVIPREGLNGGHSEYFVLEYASEEANNKRSFFNGNIASLFQEGGLRVLHCDASLWKGKRIMELKWNNYGENYDRSNKKQRVLRLANEAEGGAFFRPGDLVTDRISGFHWYDADGGQTVSPGVRISVDSISGGICTVTVSPEPAVR